tara:strand:- start:1377 stop:1580 length:204 start_codon:yes stop_codon:yes gene_type:complete
MEIGNVEAPSIAGLDVALRWKQRKFLADDIILIVYWRIKMFYQGGILVFMSLVIASISTSAWVPWFG